MIDLLLRLFIPQDGPEARASVGRFAGLLGIVCNCLLSALKLVTGLLTGSVSILADALNNLSDAASSVLTLLGFRLAQRPADADHPFGHARYEYLSGLGVSVLILLIGVELAQASLEKIFSPETVTVSAATVFILLISIGLKFWMSLAFRKMGKRIQSGSLEAMAVDSRNDVLTTAGVLLGVLVQWRWDVNVDGYVGLAVAAFILFSGWSTMQDTVSPLLGRQADSRLLRDLNQILTSHEKVLGVHDLLVHDYGPGQCFASAHVEISAGENVMDAHSIIDSLEKQVRRYLNVHLVIHYDPVALDDPQWEVLREKVTECIMAMDSRLTIHDFRIARQLGNATLVFHLEVPYEMDVDFSELQRQITRSLRERGIHFPIDINFDRKP